MTTVLIMEVMWCASPVDATARRAPSGRALLSLYQMMVPLPAAVATAAAARRVAATAAEAVVVASIDAAAAAACAAVSALMAAVTAAVASSLRRAAAAATAAAAVAVSVSDTASAAASRLAAFCRRRLAETVMLVGSDGAGAGHRDGCGCRGGVVGGHVPSVAGSPLPSLLLLGGDDGGRVGSGQNGGGPAGGHGRNHGGRAGHGLYGWLFVCGGVRRRPIIVACPGGNDCNGDDGDIIDVRLIIDRIAP